MPLAMFGGKPNASAECMWMSAEDAGAAEEMKLQRKILRCLQNISEAVEIVGRGTVCPCGHS